jgi:hypothetical protein
MMKRDVKQLIAALYLAAGREPPPWFSRTIG